MSKNFYLHENGTFVVKDYNRTYPFANFLPAVAGEWGVPLWAFYVNRAQGIVSFGVHDKNHAITEFYPADKAYHLVSTLGFRTFIKIDNKAYYEPFKVISGLPKKEKMSITSYDLTIEELNTYFKLRFLVNFFTLPNTPFASLVRVLKIKNLSSKKVRIMILDGLPRIIPFGAQNLFLKNLSRTLEAWMDSRIDKNMGIFRLLVDPKDVAQTKPVRGANFNYVFYQDGKIIYPRLIVDPTKIFGMDTSLSTPLKFLERNFKNPSRQITRGRAPCAFSFFEWELKKDEEKTFYSLFGGAFTKDTLREAIKKVNVVFIKEKVKENREVIEKIKDNALCISSFNNFNQYIKYTYLDNILRGGYPYSSRDNKIYYIFSRKHGDLERDYNKFKIFASYFSQGETNYRDVNQNRRMDLFFNPFIKKKNIIYFLNLIKIDGYNPLVTKGEKLYFDDEEKLRKILRDFKIKEDPHLVEVMKRGFYLGELFILFMDRGIKLRDREVFLNVILSESQKEPIAEFGKGYWIDHWHYNLDLIENFLYFYPDKIKELFLDTEFMFWDDAYRIKKRIFRYILRDNKVYQSRSVEKVEKKETFIEKRFRFKHFLREDFGKGKVYKTNLFVKLLSLILNKATSLDPCGIGVEMEADRPGWCDSLNGLPTLFGSSFCETLELKRTCKLILEGIKKIKDEHKINLPQELYEFFKEIDNLLKEYFSWDVLERDYLWWDKANLLKENFREFTFLGISGKLNTMNLKELKEFIDVLIDKLNLSIKKAKYEKSKFYHAYLFYEVKDYQILEGNFIKPTSFVKKNLPLFLEAAVHTLRTEGLHSVVDRLRKSPLFDKKLKMYRLNSSFKKEPLEIGRSRVFPRGWLENESIWLHMEYKYILELLKNGFYKDFYRDFFNCLVCFFDPKRYGRNMLENSSFIVSSVYTDSSLWGKGFVARLTGATAELLNMWILMCLGQEPFFLDKDNNLCIRLAPLLKKEFFTKKDTHIIFDGKKIKIPSNSFAFKLFSSVLVIYYNPKRKDTFSIKVKKIVIETPNKFYTIN